jgi:Cu-Zn family superoxide dismutase
LAASVALASAGVALARETDGAPPRAGGTESAAAMWDEATARATLRLEDGTAAGRVAVLRAGAGRSKVMVWVEAPRLASDGGSFHGFHVHANDDPTNGKGCVADPAEPASTWFASADGHYADADQDHGSHRGDLPVLYMDAAGRGRASFVTDRFRPQDVIRRAVILHALPDNYANIPTGSGTTDYTPNDPEAAALTMRTGNAGDRLACGVLRRAGRD